jgi:hypothetical protein
MLASLYGEDAAVGGQVLRGRTLAFVFYQVLQLSIIVLAPTNAFEII